MRDTSNIPDNVKRIARNKKLRIADVERACSVSPGYLSRFKKNRSRGMSTDILIKLSDVLEVTIDELLGEAPVFTNADKFREVFGIDGNDDCICCSWWDDPYEEVKST